ncbi:MAG: serine/threonine protein phosphatase [Paenibacillus sp. RIFOXYA1_FULL_44_5]|nr:MAG: serine/threonine protein phosphatase [Paenibacillus sp. RIFOXYA1_FULL_44_5]
MKVANKTDIGLIRLVNEDRALIEPDFNGYTLAIIADGMGGHQAGEIASQMAAERVRRELSTAGSDLTFNDYSAIIVKAIEKANNEIFSYASNHEEFHGMGTTVVVALVSDTQIIAAHIGDSRAYIIEDDKIRQLTEDHSLVNELVKSGQISPSDANRHPHRNVLTRALGTDKCVEVDFQTFSWKQNDILMLCTDGLSGLIDDNHIHSVLRSSMHLEAKVDQLVQSALDAGGEDNITVILLENEPNSSNEKG